MEPREFVGRTIATEYSVNLSNARNIYIAFTYSVKTNNAYTPSPPVKERLELLSAVRRSEIMCLWAI